MSDKLVEASKQVLDAWNGEDDESAKRLVGAMQDLSDALEEGDNVPAPESRDPNRAVIDKLRAAIRGLIYCPAMTDVEFLGDSARRAKTDVEIDKAKLALEFAAENEVEYSPKTVGANTHDALIEALKISLRAMEVAIDYMNHDHSKALVRIVIDKTRSVLAAAKEAGQ